MYVHVSFLINGWSSSCAAVRCGLSTTVIGNIMANKFGVLCFCCMSFLLFYGFRCVWPRTRMTLDWWPCPVDASVFCARIFESTRELCVSRIQKNAYNSLAQMRQTNDGGTTLNKPTYPDDLVPVNICALVSNVECFFIMRMINICASFVVVYAFPLCRISENASLLYKLLCCPSLPGITL